MKLLPLYEPTPTYSNQLCLDAMFLCRATAVAFFGFFFRLGRLPGGRSRHTGLLTKRLAETFQQPTAGASNGGFLWGMKMVSTPLYPMVLLIIIPIKWLYMGVSENVVYP